MILSIDLGTGVTKVAAWDDDGLVAAGRADIATSHPRPGWSEQDPRSWWSSVVEACGAVRHASGEARWAGVTAIGLTGARESFVCAGAQGDFVGPGILWSDRRAEEEAEAGGLVDPARARQRSGIIIDAGSPLAKVAWLQRNDPHRLRATRWLLSPRDAVVQQMTGRPATDITMAARAGFTDLDGEPTPAVAEWLPAVLSPTDTAGDLAAEAANDLGLRAGIPVIIGAGDRACEVVGGGTAIDSPIVSWGTTANLSVPVEQRRMPQGATLSPGALGGYLIEYGLSAAGAALDWLAQLCQVDAMDLAADAGGVAPGAGGILAVPWLHGARAPRWHPRAGAAFFNLASGHRPADLARAVIEGVALELCDGIDLLPRPPATLTAAGGGTSAPIWVEVLSCVTGLSLRLRRTSEAASVGALLVTAAGLGHPIDLDRVNPVVRTVEPVSPLVEMYRALRPKWELAATAALATS